MAEPMTYFILTVTKEGRSPKIFKKGISFKYSDGNYLQVEGLIKDTVTKLACDYIEKEYYSQ